MVDLDALNTLLTARGIRFQVEQRRQTLTARGTFPQLDGSRKRGRIPLGLQAVSSDLITAELRCLQLHTAIQAGTYPPTLPWSTPVDQSNAVVPPISGLTCEAALRSFEATYWQSRARTSASERTWERVHGELRRLPPAAPCTLQLMVQTIVARTKPNSRARLECCKVYKRLARHLNLEGDLEGLTRLQGSYEPAERLIPNDAQIEKFLDAAIATKWGWCYAALATFGCRPAEIPSLVIHADGTASCLTIKRHNRAPALRTCFALPLNWIERYALRKARLPNDVRWTRPSEYDSLESRRFVDAWRHGQRTRELQGLLASFEDFDLYTLRHRWAIRSIEAGKPLTLCAHAMGHSATVHERTYHHHIQHEDLRKIMAAASAG